MCVCACACAHTRAPALLCVCVSRPLQPARIVKPEDKATAGQELGNNDPASTNINTTIKKLLYMVLPMLSML